MIGAEYGLPEGVSLIGTLAVLIPISVVTFLLRWLPFSVVKTLKGSPFMGLLSKTMPVGVMTVLVVYCLYNARTLPGNIPVALLATAVTLALHMWRRDSALSIIGGTVFYMLMVNIVFA
ncbi:branched-chain amino acid transport protein [Corynebacterium kutscheri]|uniref:Branched-chain amino acid transport protein n=1 Tax=Corynebacterium kutscheri TaxID=35755 RepID=A0A0F6R256_9CORY|nr:AzlD domain-containing protein [Corynebacterium kutscheri]AKE42275.1 putative branched-chain amino acid permease [Corynebacterium kutscheri]VEH05628.1 branched-chain amino acid transport protein [Corynebacterium kutscheri]VEH10619.1 branched-chain amino acid transport protein [Corynebacterium kutscheri]VEH81522.1 branched-chain amino acid transport protein [Corynebacterium kutscheri]